jgi:hypothetical protein
LAVVVLVLVVVVLVVVVVVWRLQVTGDTPPPPPGGGGVRVFGRRETAWAGLPFITPADTRGAVRSPASSKQPQPQPLRQTTSKKKQRRRAVKGSTQAVDGSSSRSRSRCSLRTWGMEDQRALASGDVLHRGGTCPLAGSQLARMARASASRTGTRAGLLWWWGPRNNKPAYIPYPDKIRIRKCRPAHK